MCTCIAYENGDFYFGRNMDLDYSIGEQIILTPRNYLLELRKLDPIARHYAMVGMAASEDKFPLYAEAVNEKGLFMAGLNFPENAVYQEAEEGWKNITPFELIPWILASFSGQDRRNPFCPGDTSRVSSLDAGRWKGMSGFGGSGGGTEDL